MENETEILILGLLVAVPALSVIARLIGVPYPIVLVVGALPIGFIPGVPDVELDPELVLVIFLPPLLYVAAFFANLRELKADARAISMLSIGLVALTTCAVAVAAHLLIDGLPWAAAFALGAIVSPTDPVAATTIARRLGAPRRLVTIIEGESLVNDASALILYRVAVAAAIGGTFSALDASLEFVVAVAGGIAVGLVAGFLISRVRRLLDDPPVEITISLFSGYAAYLPAEELGVLRRARRGHGRDLPGLDGAADLERERADAVDRGLGARRLPLQRRPVHPRRPAASRHPRGPRRQLGRASWSDTRRRSSQSSSARASPGFSRCPTWSGCSTGARAR